MRVWQAQQPRPIDIDSFAQSFQVTGCGKTLLHACAYPRVGVRDNPYYVTSVRSPSSPQATDVTFHTENYYCAKTFLFELGVLKTAVVCMPGDGS